MRSVISVRSINANDYKPVTLDVHVDRYFIAPNESPLFVVGIMVNSVN